MAKHLGGGGRKYNTVPKIISCSYSDSFDIQSDKFKCDLRKGMITDIMQYQSKKPKKYRFYALLIIGNVRINEVIVF